MKAAIICFTLNGLQTGFRLRHILQNTQAGSEFDKVEVWCKKKDLPPVEETFLFVQEPLQEWSEKHFSDSELLIFVGASGIAVRAIAPSVRSKTQDPAVLCIDELGSFVISLLSGHIGRANEWTAAVAKELEAIPVITTATDLHEAFAVDVFARKNHLEIDDMKLAKEISAAILDGKRIGFASEIPFCGPLPKELVQPFDPNPDILYAEDFPEEVCDMMIRVINPVFRLKNVSEEELREAAEGIDAAADVIAEDKKAEIIEEFTGIIGKEKTVAAKGTTETVPMSKNSGTVMRQLFLIPRCITLGAGCRKQTDPEVFRETLHRILQVYGADMRAVIRLCSIDVKADEEAMLAFSKTENIPFQVFTAEQLLSLSGSFTGSEFVQQTIGVDNVCERSAMYGAGDQGFLVIPKAAGRGVTLAAAAEPVSICF